VPNAHLRGFVPGTRLQVAVVTSRCQRVNGLIGLGFETHTSRAKSRRLTTSEIMFFTVNNE